MKKLPKKIWLSSPHIGGNEMHFVEEAFDTNWVAPLGPNVDGFEQDLQNYLGDNVFVSAVTSGTAALHLALILLGVSHGDEVLCQTLTFCASANPIVYLGAKPVFIDSEEQTWNMSPEFLEEAIVAGIKKGKKAKAIIVVHLYGMPAKMDEILSLAAQYEIPVIEDAAEALGSGIGEHNCGTLGNISILSFNGNKIITTSGGGALVSKNKNIIEKSRFLATQARDPAIFFQHSEIGYNYRMSNISAGIGRGQMQVLPDRVHRRREIFNRYRDEFRNSNEVTFLDEPHEYFSNRWLSTLLFTELAVKKTDLLSSIESLNQLNVECRPLWKPLHMQPVFRNCSYYGSDISPGLFHRGLCLPSGSNLTDEEISTVIKYLKYILNIR